MLLVEDRAGCEKAGRRWPAPKVSVIIPAYKAEGTIDGAIATVVAQSLPELEVIVVDDASSDRTFDRARDALQAAGLPYAVTRLEVNAGPSGARNAGVALARGDYVAFLDSDDTWMPEKLRLQVEFMERHPEVTLCGCRADLVTSDDRVIGPLFRDLPDILQDGWKRLLWEAFIQTSCVLVRRADLGIRPFDPTLRVAEDRDLWVRLASNGTVGLVNQTLVRKLEHSSSYMASNQMLISLDTRRMIHFHIRAMRDFLTHRDRLFILGGLHSQIGKGLSGQPGAYLRSAKHLLLAVAMCFNPFDNARHMVLSAPPVRALRAALRRRGVPGRAAMRNG